MPVDVRVIAATNRDLNQRIEDGLFRLDLSERIAYFCVGMPPLRDRPDDIPLLLRYFLDVFAKKHERLAPHVAEAALEALPRYDWRGNVRGIRQLAARLVIACQNDPIDVSDIRKVMSFSLADASRRSQGRDSEKIPGPEASLSDVELWHSERALAFFNGNKTKAADSLDVTRPRLYRILDGKRSHDAQ